MFWYIVRVKANKENKFVNGLNQYDDLNAFIPKIEKWYTINGIKGYSTIDLYPNYIFITTDLNQHDFYEQYKALFASLNSLELLDYDDVYALNDEEQSLMEKLLNQGDVIKHSVGNIVNSRLIIDSGPLVNLEDQVIKIDRHHRTATLKNSFFNGIFKVPLEVVSKT